MVDIYLSLSSLILCIVFPLFLFIFVTKFKTTTLSDSKLPKSYPIFGTLFTLLKNKDRYVQWTSDVVTSAPNLNFILDRAFGRIYIITANPDNVRHILTTNFSNYEKGEFFRTAMSDFLGDGIFNADGEKWKFQRQISSHEFNTKSLRKFMEHVVESELLNRLIPILKNAADNKTIVDFQDILQRFGFDNVCRIAFGYDPGYLSPSSLPVDDFAVAFDKAVKLSSDRLISFFPNSWKMKKALNVGSEKELKIAVKRVRKFAKEIIREKKKKEYSVDDLLSRFLSYGDLDEEFAVDIMISFILAGRDSTSAALTWFFWLLSKSPGVESEIMKEIKEENEMVYTQASLYEAMRLYPPVPVDTKRAANDDVLPDGTIVKKGMRVTYHPYAMGRVEKAWGPDWAVFRPTRWLERKEEEEKWSFVNRDSYSYPVFQAGPRICLGKEMAFMQMKRVVAAVVGRFKVVPVVAEPVLVTDLTAKMKGGFPVRIEAKVDDAVA